MSRGIDRKILHIALPSIVSNITVPLLGLTDTAIAGHMGAPAYIGTIAVGGMIFNMVYWLFGFLRMGTGGLTSQAYGAGRTDECARVLLRALGVALSCGLLFVVLQRPLGDLAFRLLDATDEVKRTARTYYDVLVWGAPAVLGLYSFTGWFLGMQNARIPMYIAVAQNVVNIAASVAFVFGAGWKVEGVAAGTLIAQYAGLAMAALWWLRRYRPSTPRIGWRDVAERGALGRFFAVNRDIFLRTLCLVAVTTGFTSAGAAGGDLVLAVNALLMQFFVIFSYVMDGFAYAGEAVCGKYYGARNRAAFGDTLRRLFMWGGAMVALFTAVYAIGGTPFLRLLTTDEAVIRASAEYFPWAVAIPAAGVLAFIWDGVFIGMTATRAMLLSLVVAAAAFFATYLSLGDTLGNHALWLAMIVYLFMRGLAETVAYRFVMKN